MKSHTTDVPHKNESIWSATAAMPACRKLTEDLRADVCVVGAGIAGLTTAYLLGQAGKSVVVLDDGSLAGGVTCHTTAHLSNALDEGFASLERLHGKDGARLAAESHAAAIDRIEAIARTEGIGCDFTRLDGYLFPGRGQGEDVLERELDAARRAGLPVEKLENAPVAGFQTGPCLRYANQGQFHPLKYLAGVAKAILRDGGRLYTDTHVDDISGGPEFRVKAGPHEVRAAAVVVATNAPVIDRVVIHTKQTGWLSYVIGAKVQRGAVTRALFWDTEDPYHFIRLQPVEELAGRPGGEAEEGKGEFDLLIVGGEDHRTGQAKDTADRHARLEAWAKERFPFMGPVEYAWSAQSMYTLDGLAFIGKDPMGSEGVYVVTGDCGMGMTHGTIAGILLTDLIVGRANPWATLYDPSRKTLRAAGGFTQRVINMVDQYGDWLTGGEVQSPDNVPVDSGAVVRRGLSKVAVYRDEEGKLHERSAVCAHLGCIVSFNDSEKTWDCPCHGSRYDRFGTVVNGPANRNLGLVEGE